MTRRISIHALLAESDGVPGPAGQHGFDFYPRSPCGERPLMVGNPPANSLYFYPRSPCGERRYCHRYIGFLLYISIHALLAESDHPETVPRRPHADISIHALLAESDRTRTAPVPPAPYFYPRSPCGERRINRVKRLLPSWISIHALLAESDAGPDCQGAGTGISIHALLAESDLYTAICCAPPIPISIHALLAESDEYWVGGYGTANNFYPRSPCGERPRRASRQQPAGEFLSTLSLRRATGIIDIINNVIDYFYPRSPCGERRICY